MKHLRTADCVVAGFRLHKDGKGVGSLLLGLYDDDGTLHHVGVASSFAAKLRAELAEELEPFREDALDGHPWADWAERGDESDGQRRPGAGNRWNGEKDMSWEPLRIERVAEVAYEHMQGDRFRHTARFQRWRPDRDARLVHLRAARSRGPRGAPRRLRGLTPPGPPDTPRVRALRAVDGGESHEEHPVPRSAVDHGGGRKSRWSPVYSAGSVRRVGPICELEGRGERGPVPTFFLPGAGPAADRAGRLRSQTD